MTLQDWLLLGSAIGEFLIAFVIYWEWEGNRLDRFLEDAGDKNEERKKIFNEYCGLNCPEGKARNQAFKDMLSLMEHEQLREICNDNIRLFSRVGARLPLWPTLKNRVLDWHVVVFLWEILGPYVEERRRAAGPSFAVSFLGYALASVKRLLRQRRDEWVIVDPDLARKQNVSVTRNRLEQMREELQASLASK